MAGITQTIPSYSAGMSEQPDNLKFPGQVTESVNAIPDITKGLFKRPGLKRIDSSLVNDSDRSHSTAVGKLHDVQSGGSWFHYYRDEAEGSYIGQIDSSGNVRVWSCKTGERMTTAYGTGGETAIKAYLATNSPENIQTLTINDSTFVSNRDDTNSNTAITTNFAATYSQSGTTVTVTKVDHQLTVNESVNLNFTSGNAVDGEFKIVSVPSTSTFTVTAASSATNSGNVLVTPITDLDVDKHFALIELIRAENGRQYGLNITNGTDASSRNITLKRATRIRIKSQTLNEDVGSGECYGIGTEVFDISTDASADLLPTGNVNTSTEIISKTGHGFDTDTILLYHSAGGTTMQDTQNFFADNRDFYVSKVDDNSFKLKYAPSENTSSTLNLNNSGNNSQLLRRAERGIVVNSNGSVVTDNSKKNLVFRISTLGQQGNANNSSTEFVCSYQPEVTLLHGGEGWETGDVITVAMTGQGFGGGGARPNSPRDDFRVAVYTIEVTDHEETTVAAKYNGASTGLIRPAVTPFDADTTVTSDTILAGMKSAIEQISGTPITVQIIGSVMYLSSTSTFNVEIVEQDLMRVMQNSVNDVTNLPNQCKHGYIVQVKNARMADEDDYYLRFDGQNGKDGSGAWSECAKPGIAKRLFNLPVVIQRTASTTFTVKKFDYHDRRVGDPGTNPLPSFIQTNSNGDFIGRVNKVLFFRNRLAILSGENVILSRPGTLGKPDFFAESALTTSASDPIDISAASMFPSELFDGIEINTGLIVFSSNQQFLLTSDDTVLNPDTAKLKSIATFNYNIDMPPISLGTTVAYVDNSGRFSRLNEMANIAREGEPNIVEVSKVVPSLLPNDIDLLTNSRENAIILLGKTGTNIVFGYKYLNIGDKRQQAAWFKWKLNKNLIYHFIIDDEYFILDSDYYLQSMQLVESTDDLSITQDGVDYLLHLDNYVPLFGGTYNSATNKTTFTVPWLNQISNAVYNLAVIDTIAGTNNARLVRYQTTPELETSGTTLTLVGDWATGVTSGNPLHIGYVYNYQVTFPKFYPFKTAGEGKVQSDVNSSLVLHRVKLHFGKLGTYETTLERVGKTDYTELYESSILDEYNTNSAPYLETYIKAVPIYERNTNITLTLKSTHPSPATLHALSWEADYSPRFYNRV
jgi:hypothetical protein